MIFSGTIALPDPTPVRIIEGGSSAYDLRIKGGSSSDIIYVGDSPSITPASSHHHIDSQTYELPAGVDLYAVCPSATSYPRVFDFIALPRSGGVGTFTGSQITVGATPAPVHARSEQRLRVVVNRVQGGEIRIGGSGISGTDGFTGQGIFYVEPGDQLYVVQHSSYPTGGIISVLASTAL